MAIAVTQTVVEYFSATQQTTHTVTLPTFTTGDVVVISLNHSPSGTATIGTATIPSGWTQVGVSNNTGAASDSRLTVIWRRMQDGDGSTLNVSSSTVMTLSAILVTYDGVNLTTAIDVTPPTMNKGTSSTVPCPSITTVTANTRIVRVAIADGAGLVTETNPAGHTHRGWMKNDPPSNGASISMSDIAQAAIGASGTANFAANAEEYVAFTFALREEVLPTPPCVVSVEHATIEMGTAQNFGYYPLTKGQVQAQCVPMFISYSLDEDSSTADAYGNSTRFNVRMLDISGTPNVEVRRQAANSTAASIHVSVVEFIDDIEIQTSDMSGSDTAVDTISSVDMAHTFMVCTGQTSGASSNADDHAYRTYISSSTQVIASRYSTGNGTSFFQWYTVEDTTGGDHFNVQHGSANFTGFGTSVNYTIPNAVDVDKSFVIGSCSTQNISNDADETAVRYRLTGTTTVNCLRQAANQNRLVYNVIQVVELQAAEAQVVRGDSALGTSESGNFSLGVTFSQNNGAWCPSGDYYDGCRGSGATGGWATTHYRLEVDSGKDGVDVTRTSNGTGLNYTFSWEAIDFGSDSSPVDVPVTGVAATGSVGSVTVTGEANVPVTGLSATGQVGSVAVGLGVGVPVTGVFGTGEVGSVTVIAGISVVVPVVGVPATGWGFDKYGFRTWSGLGESAIGGVGTVVVNNDIPADAPVTGVAATGQVGAVTTVNKTNIAVSGLEASGEVGTVSIKAIANVDVTGLQARVFYGDIVVDTQTLIDVTGLEATGSVGSLVAITGTANIPTGNLSAIGHAGQVDVTGLGLALAQGSEGTGHVGSVSVTFATTVSVTGLSAAGQVGSVTVEGKAVVPVTGVSAAGQVGAVLTFGEAIVTVEGIEAVGSVGTVGVTASGSITVGVGGQAATGLVGVATVQTENTLLVTGLEATGEVGTVAVTISPFVSVTGVSATGQVGSVTVDASVKTDVPVTGVSATGEVGSVIVTGTGFVYPEGLVATGSVGEVSLLTEQLLIVTGLQADGEVGSVTVVVIGTTTVPVTGLPSAGQVGSVEVSGDALVTPTGVAATGQVGSVTVNSDTEFIVTGLEATGEVGSVEVSGDANVPVTLGSDTGYGTGTYGTGTWSGLNGAAFGAVGQVLVHFPVSPVVSVTGLEATGFVGTVGVSGYANVDVTGLEGTGEVGDAEAGISVIVEVTGLSGSAYYGDVVVIALTNVFVGGLSATGHVGSITVDTETRVLVTGLEATGLVGTVDVKTGEFIVVDVTGVEATGEVGTVTVTTGATVFVTGLEASGEVGQVASTTHEIVLVTGLSAAGSVGLATVPDWICIDPEDGSGWGEITPSQSSDWSDGSISN